MSLNTAYIGLGSNLDDPDQQIEHAIQKVSQLTDCKVSACSSLYTSKPMGPQDQPDYMNAVIAIETSLSAIDLLDRLQAIELQFGRVRKEERWGARVLDLDILLFANQVINSERLTVPHYGMKQREFVIYPLLEINPDLTMPDGTIVMNLQKVVPKNGIFIVRKLHID